MFIIYMTPYSVALNELEIWTYLVKGNGANHWMVWVLWIKITFSHLAADASLGPLVQVSLLIIPAVYGILMKNLF